MDKFQYITKEFSSLCVVDNSIYKLVGFLDDICFKLKITPNMVTSISIPFIIGGLYLLHKNSYWSIPCIIIYIISDYLDGYLARNHDMVTEFGDWYDHSRDAMFFVLFIYVVGNKIYNNKKYTKINLLFIFIILVMFILASIRFACNEKKMPVDSNKSVEVLLPLCVDDNFGKDSSTICLGSFFLLLVIFMYIIIKQNK